MFRKNNLNGAQLDQRLNNPGNAVYTNGKHRWSCCTRDIYCNLRRERILRTSSVNRRASRKGRMSTNPVSRRSSVQLSMGRPLSTTVQAPPHTNAILPGCIRNEAEELSRRQTLDKSGSTSCRFLTYTPICSRHAYPAPHMSMKRKRRVGGVQCERASF